MTTETRGVFDEIPVIDVGPAMDGSQAGLEEVAQAIDYAYSRGLQVNAGHGLNRHNVKPVAANRHITELNIGHALVADAVFVGFAEAVREMKRLMVEARLS